MACMCPISAVMKYPSGHLIIGKITKVNLLEISHFLSSHFYCLPINSYIASWKGVMRDFKVQVKGCIFNLAAPYNISIHSRFRTVGF